LDGSGVHPASDTTRPDLQRRLLAEEPPERPAEVDAAAGAPEPGGSERVGGEGAGLLDCVSERGQNQVLKDLDVAWIDHGNVDGDLLEFEATGYLDADRAATGSSFDYLCGRRPLGLLQALLDLAELRQ
jgi:hypothetical protein